MNMKSALVDVPVLILFFNRPQQLSQVFEQVKKARPSRLFLYQDGARNERDLPGIEACREIVSQIDWECEVERLYQEKNFGCDPSEYLSQRWAFSMVDKCIVLEDDDVPSQSFFPFCKERIRFLCVSLRTAAYQLASSGTLCQKASLPKESSGSCVTATMRTLLPGMK